MKYATNYLCLIVKIYVSKSFTSLDYWLYFYELHTGLLDKEQIIFIKITILWLLLIILVAM